MLCVRKKSTSSPRYRLRNFLTRLRLSILERRKHFTLAPAVGIDNLHSAQGGIIVSDSAGAPIDSFIIEAALKLSGCNERICQEAENTPPPISNNFHTFMISAYGALLDQKQRRYRSDLDDITQNTHAEADIPLACQGGIRSDAPTSVKEASGAIFLSAVRLGLPIIPILTVIKNSGIMRGKSSIIRYVPCIGKPIYPDTALGEADAARKLIEENRIALEGIYEREYGVPFTCERRIVIQAQ